MAKESAFVDRITNEVGKEVVGQTYMIERILVGLLTGHVLLEGVPGLAKTLAVRTLCDAMSAKFARVQFTPDLLAADLVGTVIYNQQKGEFTSKLGPGRGDSNGIPRARPSGSSRIAPNDFDG